MLPLLRKYYLHIALAVVVLTYTTWSVFSKHPQQPSAGFVVAKPAIAPPKVDGPVLKAPLKIVPKKKVKEKFPEAHIADDEEVIDTANIDELPDGGTAIITIAPNGETRTEIKAKETPWFAFERKNYLGVGYELHPTGQAVKAYYKRDLLRIKDIHIQGEAQVKMPLTINSPEAFIGGNVEYRF